MPIQMFDQENNRGELLSDASQPRPFVKGLYGNYGKRALDILLATAGSLMLWPLLGLLPCCIKLTSRGPALFRQIRIGNDGRPFQILKFRSMVRQSPDRN